MSNLLVYLPILLPLIFKTLGYIEEPVDKTTISYTIDFPILEANKLRVVNEGGNSSIISDGELELFEIPWGYMRVNEGKTEKSEKFNYLVRNKGANKSLYFDFYTKDSTYKIFEKKQIDSILNNSFAMLNFKANVLDESLILTESFTDKLSGNIIDKYVPKEIFNDWESDFDTLSIEYATKQNERLAFTLSMNNKHTGMMIRSINIYFKPTKIKYGEIQYELAERNYSFSIFYEVLKKDSPLYEKFYHYKTVADFVFN